MNIFNNTFTRTCTPTTGYFYEEAKISKENLLVDYYLMLKYCKRLQLGSQGERAGGYGPLHWHFDQNAE